MKKITLTEQATLTYGCLDKIGVITKSESGDMWQAPAVDNEGNEYNVYWEMVKDDEGDANANWLNYYVWSLIDPHNIGAYEIIFEGTQLEVQIESNNNYCV